MENSIGGGKFDRDKVQYSVKIDESGLSKTQSQNGSFLAIPAKLLKCYLTLLVIFIIYLIMLLTRSTDEVYVVVGGFLGVTSSVYVMYDIVHTSKYDLFNTLFWRAVCDMLMALTCVLYPAYNYYLCGSNKCNVDDANNQNCMAFSVWVEFFIVASEAWTFCNGLELINSIAKPFSTAESRLKQYHFYVWIVAFLFSVVPFFTTIAQDIYGIWYVTINNDTASICWLKTHDEDRIGYSLWFLFITPLLAAFLFCVFAVFFAYHRLQYGFSRSFLPHILTSYKLLLTNISNISIIVLYWVVFISLYTFAFYTSSESFSTEVVNILHCIFGSKGVATLLIWFLNANISGSIRDNEKNEKVDISTAFREEVLFYATTGIRSTARASGASVTPTMHEMKLKAVSLQAPASAASNTSSRSGKGSGLHFSLFIRFLLYDIDEVLAITKQDEELRTMSDTSGITEDPMDEINPMQIQSNRLPTGSKDAAQLMRPSERFARVTDEETAKSKTVPAMINNYFFSYFDTNVEFIELQPYHFRRVRLAAGITDETFMQAFSSTIKERITEGGASGAFFFFSKGETFLAKSCTTEEADVLNDNGKAYADYMEQNKESFISKILGAYRLRLYGLSLSFFVMNNLFYNPEGITIHEKYDIKGSWEARNAKPLLDGQSATCAYCQQKFTFHKKRKDKRKIHMSKDSYGGDGLSGVIGGLKNSASTRMSKFQQHQESSKVDQDLESKDGDHDADSATTSTKQTTAPTSSKCSFSVNREHEPSIILKDNDVKSPFRLAPKMVTLMIQQLRKDAKFLSSIGIMDYSLLVGVHNTEYVVKVDIDSSKMSSNFAEEETASLISSGLGQVALTRKLKADVSSRAEAFKIVGPDSYFIGIIDFQQKWNWRKKMERLLKVLIRGADPDGLSAIEPAIYRERFLRKMEDVFESTETAYSF